jgi:FAD dependent oxidoreductase TIGR03364
VRNFGMIWPIGQPGPWHAVALRGRQRWASLARAAGLWLNPCGSIHLAHRDDEWNVLEEFHALAPRHGFECELLKAEQVLSRAPAANPAGLRGGLYSPTEAGVNPPAAIRKIADWLASAYDVRFAFRMAIAGVERGAAIDATGKNWPFDRIVVCGGSDLATLFPGILAKSGLRLCKLQMMKTPPQPGGWRLGPHLASGLTLRHYRNFEICGSLAALKKRVADETPDLDRYGIHVMASQNDEGSVILGDSHEYDGDIEPFDKAIIDELILGGLRKIIRLPDWSIAERWHGFYAKHPSEPIFAVEPLTNVFIRMGTSGSGMTMSLILAERDWEQWS